MKKLLLCSAIALITTGCAQQPQFPVSSLSSGLGEGNQVTLEENSFELSGQAIQVGQKMPGAILKDGGFGDHDPSQSSDSVRIYSIMPSIDTPVCEQQAHELSEFLEENEASNIAFYAVSADTPFAQANFQKEGKISEKVTFLSDARSHQFGELTGTQIEPLGLLTRSIIVVGKDSTVLHIQRVPELTTVPDLEEAIKVAQDNI